MQNTSSVYEDVVERHSSDNGFVTSVWGPLLWAVLHMISLNYPVNPSPQQQEQYYQFIWSLCHVLPCGACRRNLPESLERVGFSKGVSMKNRASFAIFLFNLHNQVSLNTGKKPVPQSKILQVFKFYEMFRADCAATELKTQSASSSHVGCLQPKNTIRSKCQIHIVPASKNYTNTFHINSMVLDSSAKSSFDKKTAPYAYSHTNQTLTSDLDESVPQNIRQHITHACKTVLLCLEHNGLDVEREPVSFSCLESIRRMRQMLPRHLTLIISFSMPPAPPNKLETLHDRITQYVSVECQVRAHHIKLTKKVCFHNFLLSHFLEEKQRQGSSDIFLWFDKSSHNSLCSHPCLYRLACLKREDLLVVYDVPSQWCQDQQYLQDQTGISRRLTLPVCRPRRPPIGFLLQRDLEVLKQFTTMKQNSERSACLILDYGAKLQDTHAFLQFMLPITQMLVLCGKQPEDFCHTQNKGVPWTAHTQSVLSFCHKHLIQTVMVCVHCLNIPQSIHETFPNTRVVTNYTALSSITQQMQLSTRHYIFHAGDNPSPACMFLAGFVVREIASKKEGTSCTMAGLLGRHYNTNSSSFASPPAVGVQAFQSAYQAQDWVNLVDMFGHVSQ